ncbi:MAG: hypothetical protein HY064_11130 [Bacteroidetes bacterium]|nr:hypothetical protein [Bacteroidota bacterium]
MNYKVKKIKVVAMELRNPEVSGEIQKTMNNFFSVYEHYFPLENIFSLSLTGKIVL